MTAATEGATVALASHGDVTERYLTQKQVCEMFAIPMRTLENWRRAGLGPAFVRIGPRNIRYRLSDCQKWAASRTFAHRADELRRAADAPRPGSA